MIYRLFQDFHVGQHLDHLADMMADMKPKNGDRKPERDRAGMIAHLPPVSTGDGKARPGSANGKPQAHERRSRELILRVLRHRDCFRSNDRVSTIRQSLGFAKRRFWNPNPSFAS